METDNGTESQNKLLKYSHLPRRKDMTLSSIADTIVHFFLPDARDKYLFLNYKSSSDYRAYNQVVPTYLHDRPARTVTHCMECKSKALRFTPEEVYCTDSESGCFQVWSCLFILQAVILVSNDLGTVQVQTKHVAYSKFWSSWYYTIMHLLSLDKTPIAMQALFCCISYHT